MDALVIGGGVAGLAAAWQLSRVGIRALVLEREALPCTHSSGRNAAIFRHAEPVVELCRLASRSRALLDELTGSEAWLDVTGALYVAPVEEPIAALERCARVAGVVVERLGREQLAAREPALRDGDAAFGLSSPADGVIDLHVVTQALLRAARAGGAEVRCGAVVERVLLEGGRARGVVLVDGSELRADVVVLAAGAWAAELGARAGAPLSLTPLRRHLAVLEGAAVGALAGPVLWRVVEDVYVRREGAGALASPGDEEPFAPCLPPTDPEALALLAHKLSSLAPSLADAAVRRSWACLRTFAPDRNLVIGRDPRVEGLAWLAGLGGHGMTLATASAELLARELTSDDEVPTSLSPRRLLDGPDAPEHAPLES